MASAIGTALISTILPRMAAKAMDKAMAMVVDKVDGIVNIERDISNLQTTLSMIEGIVHVAEEKQIDDVCIRNWLRGLVDVAYEARDVLDDFITFSSCIVTAEEASKPVNFISSHMLSCFCASSSDTSNIPLTALNRLEKDIRSVRERFDEKKDGETFKTLISVAGRGSESIREYCIPIVGPSINKQGDGLFLGREEVKQGIMEKILHPSDDNRVHVVAIWGMGGIGKTTLAQSIYNDERVKEDDYPTKNRSWLCVGENKFSAEKLIKEIVNDTNNNDDIDSLQTKLVQELRGDRFLIVLDDVWDVDGCEWDLLFNPLTRVGKGGLIIITKREKEVCPELIKIQTACNLKPLTEQDSWSIFKSRAFTDGNSDSRADLKCIGKKIVKKLNGLPLALEVVGCSLLNKDSSIWTNFLESKLTNDDDVMSALRWSYNHLRQHLKTCFTYCSLFPKDHVLDKKALVEMWMVHDLIPKEEQERPEDVGAHYFEQLVNASLLQCVDGKYTMHDLIHDLALLVSNGEFATTDDSLPIGQMDKVRNVTITRGDYSKIPRLCKIEKLLTLYTIWSDEEDKHHHAGHNMQDLTFILDEIYPTEKYYDSVLDDVFKQLKSVRVLVLVSSKITHIPNCISELKHLRYLDVSETEVKRLPDSLCHLYNLQMLAAPLDAALPRDIVNMCSLRYLRANLSTCKGVGKLTSLQELSSIHVCEGDNIRELEDMQRLRGKLTIKDLENVEKLEDTAAALMEKQTLMDELELVFNQHFAESIISDEEVLDALGCPPNLTYLRIAGYKGLKPPSWMVDGKHKFAKLQILELSHCPKLESLSPLGEFDKLQTLQLSDCPKLESLPPLGEFDKLQTLQLFGCPKLESLPPLDEIDKLKTLQLSDFPKLESFPPLGELTSLKHLSLRNVGVKRLGGEFYGKFTDSKVFFPSLESLRFYKMQEWEKWDDLIIENSSVSFFPSLTTLKIERCAKLVSILPTVSNAADFMKSLSSLKIDECPKLISCLPVVKKWEDDEHPIMNAANFMASLSSLKICNCDGLKRLQLDALLSLKELEINLCSSLVQITSAICESLEISSCRLLEKMDVARCDSMVVIKILKLEVEDCESLRSLSIDIHGLDSLEHLHIIDCPKLELAFEDGSSSSSSGNSVAVPLHYIRTDNTQVFRTLLHHELVSLESLDITNLEGFENFGDNFGKSRLLKSLHIWQCEDLKSLPQDFHKLSSLKSLSIFNSPKLQSLPPDFHKLSSLENLDINSCPLLQSSPPDFHKLSSLKSLSINDCPQLQSLPPDFHKLSSLKSLTIKSCPQLQSLPPDFHKLSSLDKLYIFSCPLLYERCKDESGLDWHNIKNIRRKWISEI